MEMGKLQTRVLSLLQGYIDASKDAEEKREMEIDATLWIQSCWRRFVVKNKLRLWNMAANDIQRVWRGHKGRERAHARRREVDKEKRMIYFNSYIITIQRFYRGYYTRKFKHDFYRRQEFIQNALREGSHVTKDSLAYYRKQRAISEEAAINRSRMAVEHYWEYNHPRLSTQVSKGVYQAPYIWLFGPQGRNYFEDNLQRARLKKSEEEIRIRSLVEVTKDIPRNEHLRYEQIHADRYDRYITRSGPFQSMADIRMKQEKREKLEQVNEQVFYPRVHDRDLIYDKTVRTDREYGYEENLKKIERKLKKEMWRNFHRDPFYIYIPYGHPFSLVKDEDPKPTSRRESQLT